MSEHFIMQLMTPTGTFQVFNMMSSNLPLLFMDGYPTTLEQMPVEKLEIFITFMVRCSLGHDTAKEIKVPLWWPKDVPFTNPFKRPKDYRCANWKELLLNLVTKCYRYHRMENMLGFSVKLAEISKDNFRILDNWNGTTSFFEKTTSKLLVTVRNELLSYDRRKYQLRNKYHRRVETIILEPEVDTFICQNCCETFTTFKALKGHERTCSSMILIDLDDPLYDHSNSNTHLPAVETVTASPTSPAGRDSQQENFLEQFNLCSSQSRSQALEDHRTVNPLALSPPPPINRRTLLTLPKCPNIPFSSTVGQIILKRTKKELTSENINERCVRIERFTRTSPVKKLYPSQSFTRRAPTYPVTYRRPKGAPAVVTARLYNFRGRRSRLHGLNLRSQLLYRMYCSKFNVTAKRLTETDVHSINLKLKSNYPLDDIVNETNLPAPVVVVDDIIEISDSDDDDSISFDAVSVSVSVDNNDESDDSDDNDEEELEFIEEEPTIVISPSDNESENQDPLEELYGKTTIEHGFVHGSPYTDPKRRLFGTIQFSDEIPGVICVD